jgi:hypothetical protein
VVVVKSSTKKNLRSGEDLEIGRETKSELFFAFAAQKFGGSGKR